MGNNKSFLRIKTIDIAPGITLKMPKVGEVLDNELMYYNIVSSLTAVPFQYMVQLDDMNIDYTSIDDWQLFCILLIEYSHQDLLIRQKLRALQNEICNYAGGTADFINRMNSINSLKNLIEHNGFDIIFKDFKLTGEYDDGRLATFDMYKNSNDELFLYNPVTKVEINRLVHKDLTDAIRKINLFEKTKCKPGNESAKKYLLEKERKRQKRAVKEPHKSYLEKMVIGLVNTSEFPYNYEECMELSIYKFNQSLKQIQHKIAFDNTMIGVYAGTVDTSKMGNKDILSWVSNK